MLALLFCFRLRSLRFPRRCSDKATAIASRPRGKITQRYVRFITIDVATQRSRQPHGLISASMQQSSLTSVRECMRKPSPAHSASPPRPGGSSKEGLIHPCGTLYISLSVCNQPLSKYVVWLLRIGYIHGILASSRASSSALNGMLEERI